MTFKDVLNALFFKGTDIQNAIVWRIRMPRLIAALVVGVGMAIAGAVMQATLKNPIASPTSLGVSNAAVLGANIAIIALNGGHITANATTVNINNPYFVTIFAFAFALIAVFIIVLLTKLTKLSITSIILVGVAMSSFFTGVTSIIQYYASDIQLSTAIYWSFGDLGRAHYDYDIITSVVVVCCSVVFFILASRYNALLLGDDNAKALGVNVGLVRIVTLILASLVCAVCVSLFGIIGFIGIIAPQIARKLVGNNYKIFLPVTCLSGALLLVIADLLSQLIMVGVNLPVGAITSIVGAPVFIFVLLSNRRNGDVRG